MKGKDAIMALIAEASPAETVPAPAPGEDDGGTVDLSRAGTADIPGPPQEQQGQLTPKDLRNSMLARSWAAHHWHALRVYKDGQLWDIEPILGPGKKLKSFKFHQLRLTRVYEPLEPTTGDELKKLEAEFDVDRGVGGSHVTEIK